MQKKIVFCCTWENACRQMAFYIFLASGLSYIGQQIHLSLKLALHGSGSKKLFIN